ncbi:universal stress protein [Streptomyces sp. S.PB5]|uniref:universal stress protein n=1 Tax=Streptomyces sp. S.PB5 TaxID=3020844 RepID=UPI0025B24F17|nr:universal stress protein [Streptomyces sp. S.PB5]MDN3029178.1 universal stress protein [Streptomyces sp. S.PB5]
MSRPVTVGLDGSPESIAAAHWAAREASLLAAPLHLVHAGDQPPHAYVPFAGEAVPPPGADRSAHLLREVETALGRDHPRLRITSQRLAGRPATALVAAARESELLVLGSRGLGRAAGYLLGSVASAVVARTPRPVVLVRAGTETADGHRPDSPGTPFGAAALRDVVLGLELHDLPAHTLLAFAFEAAARHSVPLRVVHGWKPEPRAGAGGEPEVRTEETVAAMLRPWRDKFPGVEVTDEAAIGSAGAHLVDSSRDASLVVVGRRNRPGPLGPHIGPVTQQVLQGSEAPVVVVPLS